MEISVRGIQYIFQENHFGSSDARVQSMIRHFPHAKLVTGRRALPGRQQRNSQQPQSQSAARLSPQKPAEESSLKSRPDHKNALEAFFDSLKPPTKRTIKSIKHGVGSKYKRIIRNEDQPTDSIPELKKMPQSEFLRAMRAYKPDYGAYIQFTGYGDLYEENVAPRPKPTQVYVPPAPSKPKKKRGSFTDNYLARQAFKIYKIIEGAFTIEPPARLTDVIG